MREYRIVGTKTMTRMKDGKVDVMEGLPPQMAGYGSYSIKYRDLDVARKELEAAKKDIAKWEKSHNVNAVKDVKYGVEIHWTNIHLESREITEWEEIK